MAIVSCDDKARVPIGTTAVHSQSPLVMHMEYQVKLPDHDFVVANRHKLIPSVYGGLVIQKKFFGEKQAVSYSGPTYCAIRSGKHDSSTAESHAEDFDHLYDIPAFKNILYRDNDTKKPVCIILSDGGPDENPRFIKTVHHAIDHFIQHDFDAIFLATNAPGRSAYNPIERRMAPLSKELRGVLLPHDTFGSHLDGSKRTIDKDLEIKNFKAAGKVLAEIFSGITIDGYDVYSEYVEPGKKTTRVCPNEGWIDRHVRSSQYALQIVKCQQDDCCTPLRSCIGMFLPSRFLPPPVAFKYNPSLSVATVAEVNSDCRYASLYQNMALLDATQLTYDEYCPSLDSKVKRQRVCDQCGLYFGSVALLKNHKNAQHPKEKAGKCAEGFTEMEDVIEECSYDEGGPSNESEETSGLIQITLESYFSSPWTAEI